MLRVAITQPNYLPWLGYIALFDATDLFVSLDNVQLVRRSFIVRNRVKVDDGKASWLSQSIDACPQTTEIRHATVAADPAWSRRHLDVLAHAYRKAPFFRAYFGELEHLLQTRHDRSVARWNERVLSGLLALLGIQRPILVASELAPHPLEGSAEDKILSIIDALGERRVAFYNTARGVDLGLYRPSAFEARGHELHKQDYVHPTYAQQHGPFLSHLSIVDLLFNEGPRSLAILRSGQRWLRVHPIDGDRIRPPAIPPTTKT